MFPHIVYWGANDMLSLIFVAVAAAAVACGVAIISLMFVRARAGFYGRAHK
jgi:NADH:ubiquinone oxidoreductase subunit K